MQAQQAVMRRRCYRVSVIFQLHLAIGSPGGRGAASMPLLQRSPHSSPHGSPTSSRRSLGIDSPKPGTRTGAGGFILGAVWALLVFSLLTSSPVARLQRGEAILCPHDGVDALSNGRLGAAACAPAGGGAAAAAQLGG